MNRLKIFIIVYRLGMILGDGVWGKMRIAMYLSLARILPAIVSKEREFRAYVNGVRFNIVIRRDLADTHVLSEVFIERDYIEALKGEVPGIIFDVGANVGYVTLFLKTLYPDARIFCFEPDPQNFLQLKKNTKQYSDIRCIPYGLGSEDGTISFYRSPVFHMRNSMVAREGNTEQISVPIRSLSNALKELQVDHIDLMKIDVEGAEYGILSAFDDLRAIKRMVGELHPYLSDGTVHQELVDRLHKHYQLKLRQSKSKVFFVADKLHE